MNNIHYLGDTLWIEQIPVKEIIESVGTPCYLYSHTGLTQQWQAFDSLLDSHPHQICFAVKANSNLAVLNILAQLGSGFDIVSGGELARVLAAKGDAQKVVFSGVGKTPEEIEFALKSGIFCFNVESQAELLLLQQVAQHLNCQAPIALRVNPDIDPQSHPYWSTGMKESKFGIDFNQALLLYQLAQKQPHLKIAGIACHIGSQILSLVPFIETLKRLNELVDQLKEYQIQLSHMDIGGGLGIRYQNEAPPRPQEYIAAVLDHWRHPELKMILEPGRAIVAQAGILVTKVLSLKTAGTKQFCIVDGAMNDLLRPAMYGAWHDIIPLTKRADESPKIYDIVGPVCECGDFLGKERPLAVHAGDHLAVLNTGAYGFVMSSNFNTRPRPPEILVKGNEYKIVRKRETVAELFAQEKIW